MSKITCNLRDIHSKLTPEQEKEIEELNKRTIADDPELPKNWKSFKVIKGKDLKRKRVEAITAEKESGTGE